MTFAISKYMPLIIYCLVSLEVKKVWKYLALIEKVRVQVSEMKNTDGEVRRRDFVVDKYSLLKLHVW